MRAALLVVAAAVAGIAGLHAQMPAQGAPAPPARTGTGFILGRVLEGHSTRPVPSVIVTLTGGGASPQKVQVDGEGRFLFTKLPDGDFMLNATLAGYLGGLSGQRVPGGPGRPVSLGSGERRGDVVVRLWKFAAIGGTVFGEAGEPAAGVEVRLVPRELVDGRRVFAAGPHTSVPTDDRGVYRFSAVAPGEYAVLARSPTDSGERALMSIAMSDQSAIMAVASRAATSGAAGHIEDMVDMDTSLRVYPPTFHPATTLPAEAEVVRVAAGEERTSVDIRTTIVTVSRLGGVLLHDGQPVFGATLRLMIGGDDTEIEVATARSTKDGRFTFTSVPTGRYLLRAARVQRPQPAGARGGPPPPPGVGAEPTIFAALPVTAAGDEARNLTVSMQLGARVRGRVEFVGATERPTPERRAGMQLQLVPAGPTTREGPIAFGRIGADGTFSTLGTLPGRYRLRVIPATPWRAQSALVGGMDILDMPVTIDSADVNDVVLTFVDSQAATISGAVRTSSGVPDPDAVVVVLPRDERLIGDRRMKIARTTATGTYSVPGLPGGDYVVALTTDERLQAGFTREEIARLGQAGSRVTLADAGRETVDLRSEGSR